MILVKIGAKAKLGGKLVYHIININVSGHHVHMQREIIYKLVGLKRREGIKKTGQTTVKVKARRTMRTSKTLIIKKLKRKRIKTVQRRQTSAIKGNLIVVREYLLRKVP